MTVKKTTLILSSIMIIVIIFFSQFSYQKYAYNHADWLIKRKVLEVFKLYSDQQVEVKAVLNTYMQWHREHMLTQYIDFLARADKRVSLLESKGDKFTPEEVDLWALDIRKLYLDTMLKLAQDLSEVLLEMNESQVDRSRTLLDRRLSKWRDLKGTSKKTLLSDLLYSWKGNYEYLFGELTNDQNRIIEKTSFRLYIPHTYELAFEGRLNQRVLGALEKIKEQGKQAAKIELTNVIGQWQKESENILWRREVSKLTAKVFNLSNKKQIKYLRMQIEKWRILLTELSSQ